jgi:oligopeptide transport system substrate-binding protein
MMQHSVSRRSFLASSALTLALAGTIPPVFAAEGKVLRRGTGPAPDTLDPGKAELHNSSIVIYDLYEGLLTPGPDGEPRPGAAERWDVSPDGKTYIFHLRANGKWSDGSPVTAGDFVYAWRRLADPKTASPYGYFVWVLENGADVSAGRKPLEALGVTALDDRTLKVTLKEPAAYFLGQLSHQSLSPVKPGAEGGKPLSNGAYQLAEMIPQTHYKLVRNPHYYDNAAVKIDTVYHFVTENLDTELKRFRAGELDTTYNLPVTQVNWARTEGKQAYTPTPTYSTFYLAFNLTHEPWKSNPKLRAALSLAIDREVITEKVMNGDLLPAYSFTPSGKVAGYEPPQPDWRAKSQADRNAMAKKLFAEAGYGPGGKPLPEIEILHSTSENSKRIMVAVSAMWKQVLGVQTQLNNQEFRVVASIGNQKTYKDIIYYGWVGDFPDPINFLKLLRSDVEQQNLAAYKNPAYDQKLDEANASLDPARRVALLGEAERMYQADFPVAPIMHNNRRRLVAPKVKGWKPTPLDQNPSRWLDIG